MSFFTTHFPHRNLENVIMKQRYGIFLGEMHRHMNHEEEQKNFFCCSQVVLARGLFEGFFWPEEGRRPSEGQKNPSNSPKAKTSLAKAKQVFLFFQMMKNVVN